MDYEPPFIGMDTRLRTHSPVLPYYRDPFNESVPILHYATNSVWAVVCHIAHSDNQRSEYTSQPIQLPRNTSSYSL